VSAAAVTLFVWFSTHAVPAALALAAFTLLIVIRHRKNIGRILRHEENKVKWMR